MFGFEDLFGGGGGGFHQGMGMPRKPKGDTTILYKQLGVEKKADQTTIRKAYRNLARKHHPDRGGDPEEFKKIQNAYDCLSDPAKRKAYDMTGDPNADPRSIQGMRKRKGKMTKFELDVPMAQFYNGHTRRIRVTKNVVCGVCDGEGGSGVTACSTCRGRGVRVIDRQIGPGMIQRMQVECNTCDGKGQVIPRGQRCTACRATGIKKDSTILSVHIEKGMRHGDKITFSEEGDQSPDTTPGDVVVFLKKQRQTTIPFSRSPDGCHLILKKKISLVEALTGFNFSVEHLDGRIMSISSEKGVVYKTGSIHAIRGEGFPLRGDVMTTGHLYVELEVEYPTSLSPSQMAGLVKILGPAPEPTAMDEEKDTEVVELENVDIQAEKAAYAKLLADNPSQYEEDQDDGMHEGQQVGCRQS